MRLSRRNKIDRNQPEICKKLKDIGCTIIYLNSVGDGVPDILVGYQGKTHLMEIKMPGGKLSEEQIKFKNTWRGGPVHVVEFFETAKDVVTR